MHEISCFFHVKSTHLSFSPPHSSLPISYNQLACAVWFSQGSVSMLWSFCVDFQQVSLTIAHMTDVITKCITIATSVEVAMVILLLS